MRCRQRHLRYCESILNDGRLHIEYWETDAYGDRTRFDQEQDDEPDGFTGYNGSDVGYLCINCRGAWDSWHDAVYHCEDVDNDDDDDGGTPAYNLRHRLGFGLI